MQYGQKSIARLAMREDLDEMLELLLPEMQAVSTQALRKSGAIPRLPQMPGRSVDSFFMSNYRAQEAAEYAEAIRIAYAEKRQRDIIMRAKARAEARIAQAIAEYRD